MNVDTHLRAVAANIKDRRTAMRLSQVDMAKELNVTQNAYSKMEMSKTKLTIERLYKIAEVLDIAPARCCRQTWCLFIRPVKQSEAIC
ncbi:helix-turn-helix domain-containing protein [Mucilaginibacter antarcticus]|uniref:helix-turn-helix domain-containing protein n=1 Tax=Mucilaginibacter antarcticus TaxID=1855725 RepID=UPI003644397A